jgi:CRISPR-associated protein Cas1
MKKPLYILRSGRLKRKENTLFFELSSDNTTSSSEKVEKRVIPIETIESIYIFSEIDLNTKVLNFLAKNGIPVHIFDYYGHYSGTFMPKDEVISGYLLVRQVQFYLDKDLRIEIAGEILKSAIYNMLKNLKYYQNRYQIFDSLISEIESLHDSISNVRSISELMGIEGQASKIYFSAWNEIIRANEDIFKFEGRERKPPTNSINALISFGNSLLYSAVLDEIYKTQLNPTVSYLHEPSTRRYSLSLDIAEIFKPLLVDRVIFSLINHKRIRGEHFEEQLEFTYLNDKGKKVFISEFDEKLNTTIKHLKLKRSVSYKMLIRLECYKLIKHLIGEEKYEGFKIWW